MCASTVSEPSPCQYQFGPFWVDAAAYRLLRDGVGVTLTPQLFDLLVYLVDRAGSLVTKDALLDGLWPNANVTENALARAISELRRALDDHARTPTYIKTVARRGYRFIAPVTRAPSERDTPSSSPTLPSTLPAAEPALTGTAADGLPSIAVLGFPNLSQDPTYAWLELGIPETLTGDLRRFARFRVVDRSRVMEANQRVSAIQDIAAAVGAAFLVVGGFQHVNGYLRLTARVIDARSGDTVAEAKADGASSDVFELQDHVATQLADGLGFSPKRSGCRPTIRETSSLEAYSAWTDGWLKIETLNVRQLPDALDDFGRAIAVDAQYASAYAGLATAEFALYENTRIDAEPGDAILANAETHARHAIGLDACLAEAHATLATALVAAWKTPEAVARAQRAVALEPGQWRHLFRLCHATWGDQRLEAAVQTLALYPSFAFAHFQMAMVHVARGHLAQAETVLLDGVDVQDGQIARGERFPALGLHWLLGLVRLSQDDLVGAERQFNRELELAHADRVYGREYAMAAWLGRGSVWMRRGNAAEAIAAFTRARELYPSFVPCMLGEAIARRALGAGEQTGAEQDAVARLLDEAERAANALRTRRPIEGAIARAQLLTGRGALDAALRALQELLREAPPGFAGWSLAIDPLFTPLHERPEFDAVLRRLADRAR
jgi:DNA-binding winged helix-turn-helix (wHTH) protein/tetratricopeptide (TPR) repeat protein